MKNNKSIIAIAIFVLIFTFGMSDQALSQGSPQPGNNFSGDSSVKALWRFESGALGIDSKGTNNLTIGGSPTSDSATYKEGAAAADFDISEDDYLFITDANLNTGFPFKSAGSDKDISVVFWLRLDSLPQLYRTHFFKGQTGGQAGHSIMIATNSSEKIEFRISSDGTNWITYTHNSSLALDTWYHVAVTYQNSDGAYRIRIWDDSAQAILGSDAAGTATTTVSINASDLRIGTGAFINGNYNMDGKFDEMLVFNRALSTAEIDQIRRGEYGCDNHEIWGWVYSENIDWIGFSCTNRNPLGARVNYGVDIDEVNGRLSGYAWSENIGWISFTNTDLVGCPSGTCQASINMSTGALSGWARALAPVGRPLSETGGWDGWIKLSGSNYGVTLNSTPDPSEFQNWAWGGDPNNDNNEAVIGLISFNSKNCDPNGDGNPSDGPAQCIEVGRDYSTNPIPIYAVYTNLSVNNPPTAAISCNPISCTIYHTEVLVLNNDSSDSDGVAPLGNITQSQWETSEPPAGYIVRQTCPSNPILCDLTPQNYVGSGLPGVGDYEARLVVTDAGGLSSIATRNFSILRDAIAGFRCSLDNIIWENCDTIIPIAGELVYFIDNQAIDPNEYSQASQGGSPIISREWRRNDVVFSAGNNTNPSVISLSPSMDITLTITDSAFPSARIDTRLHTIGSVVLDLPTWNEIAPF